MNIHTFLALNATHELMAGVNGASNVGLGKKNCCPTPLSLDVCNVFCTYKVLWLSPPLIINELLWRICTNTQLNGLLLYPYYRRHKITCKTRFVIHLRKDLALFFGLLKSSYDKVFLKGGGSGIDHLLKNFFTKIFISRCPIDKKFSFWQFLFYSDILILFGQFVCRNFFTSRFSMIILINVIDSGTTTLSRLFMRRHWNHASHRLYYTIR